MDIGNETVSEVDRNLKLEQTKPREGEKETSLQPSHGPLELYYI